MRRALPFVALLALLVEERERRAPPRPSGPDAPPVGPGEAPAVRTPSSAAAVAGAIVRGYARLRGRMPPGKSAWLWPLALSANETDNWKAMFNWNAGNVMALPGEPYFVHPLVRGAANRFRAYADLDAGAFCMLTTLEHHGGIAAAEAGDRGAWQKTLNAYLGGAPYPDLRARIAALASTVPATTAV